MQEIKQDFGYQYIQFHDQLIKEYLDSIEAINPEFLKYKGRSIKGIIEKSFFAKLIYYQPLRDLFNEYLKNEGMPNHLKEQYYKEAYSEFFLDQHEINTKQQNGGNEKKFDDEAKKELRDALKPYKGQIVYYAYNVRFLELALPVLTKLQEDVIVLTYQDIPESSNYPENIMIVEFPVVKLRTCKNIFLKLKFPTLYHLFFNLEMLLKIIQPKSIIVLEGANVVEYNIMAIIGKVFNIKTVCVQHGWPGLLYSGFKNMQFDYFLSWGNQFSNLLKPSNPKLKFISTGYYYDVNPKKSYKKNAISFFFQGPYFVSTEYAIELMFDFAIYCAQTFPRLDILIREHPSKGLNPRLLNKAKNTSNIIYVSSMSTTLADVLSASIVSVAIFSSTLMESLAYGVVPFVFNPTSMPNYYPNIDKEGLGIEVKSLEEAKKKMKSLLSSNSLLNSYRKNIANKCTSYFEFTGQKAIEKTANEILKISNRL